MFEKYICEIWDISMAKYVDVGVAFDMFRTDVRLGKPYNTGDALPNFDWVAAKAEWDALTEDEQKAAFKSYRAKSLASYDALCEAYPDDREAMVRIMCG